jgi:cyclopropane-fatty-acyl-phospholipid synthase
VFPLSALFSRVVKHGELTVVDHEGRSHRFGPQSGKPAVTIRLKDKSLYRRIGLNPNLEIGNAYVDGTLVVEKGTLQELLEILLHASVYLDHSRIGAAIRLVEEAMRLPAVVNPVGRAQKNVAHHYDLSGKLYDLFLDSDKQYSCAYFVSPDDDIDTAQHQKKQHLAAKLDLRPGQKVLDIGCGWGGLALFLAREFKVRVTGLTLSVEQYRVAEERARAAGLSDRVKFKLLDYRLEDQTYDRIVSVGMFEHVGRPHFSQYFAKVKELLAEDGVALIHTIGKQCRPSPINSWIRRNIFPGAYLPTMSQLTPKLEKLDLWLTDLENLRLHYAETLKTWNRRFQVNRGRAAELYDERFCRMWEFYLLACEAGFRWGSLTVFQMQLTKRIDTLPITRDYMFEAEQRMRMAEHEALRPRMAGE